LFSLWNDHPNKKPPQTIHSGVHDNVPCIFLQDN
jgi:hypothetical protein